MKTVTDSPNKAKALESAAITAETAAYLAQGGKIETVDAGKCAQDASKVPMDYDQSPTGKARRVKGQKWKEGNAA